VNPLTGGMDMRILGIMGSPRIEGNTDLLLDEALKGVVIPDDIGIVGRGVEETIKNMGRISSPGMVETDKVILDIVGGG